MLSTSGTSGDCHQVIQQYVAAWGEANEASRLALLHSCYEDACVYSDPSVSLPNIQALTAYLADLHRRFPGCRVNRECEMDTYSEYARFHWNWSLGDGTVRRKGIDFVRFSPANRLREVVGFFDPV